MKYTYTFLMLLIIANVNQLQSQWIRSNDIGNGIYVDDFTYTGTNIFAGTESASIYLSTNNGINWTKVINGLPGFGYINALAEIGTNIFAGTDVEGVYLSTNNGAIWTPINNGITDKFISCFCVSGTNIYAGGTGLYLSTNNGSSWTSVYNGFPANSMISSLTPIGNSVLASINNPGIFLTTNNGTTWTKINNTFGSHAFIVSGTNIFAASQGNGVYLSTDNGSSWNQVNNGLTDKYVYSLILDGTNIFAGTGSGVFLSANNGSSWVNVSSGTFFAAVSSLVATNTNLIAGASTGLYTRPLSELLALVDRPKEKLPFEFNLNQNYPNPFNPSTTISFSIPSNSLVSIKIFDVLGRVVSNLLTKQLPSGQYSQQWNASNVPSGVYFYSIKAGAYTSTKKMLLLK